MEMIELRDLLEQVLNAELLQLVLSGQRTKEAPVKVKARPVMLKNELYIQCASWDGKKETHKNLKQKEAAEEIMKLLQTDFKQLQADTAAERIHVLVSKKGKATVKRTHSEQIRQPVSLSHNKKKTYLLEEGTAVPFLVELGVMTPEGKVVNSRYDKFRQINRFLEFVEDIRGNLPKDRQLTIIDFGCGKSYLTFAMYYYLKVKIGLDIRVIGLDLKEDVILHCNQLAQKFGYNMLSFQTGDIAEFEGVDRVDMVVTLHACDVATDYALAKAVRWNAKVILSVPCCQHEINRQIENRMLEPVLKYGLLKERMSALITDGLRASLLEEQGYEVQVLEFIDMEHTPKNILIRAVRRSGPRISAARGKRADRTERKKEEQELLESCMEQLHVKPTLRELLRENQLEKY